MALQDKYINPFTDFGFKKLFGTELNKDLLIDFLNAVVLPEGRRIADLQYKKSEQLGSGELDRKAIFDLYCVGEDGERFIVEMQKAKQNYFKDRSVFYATFPIQEQAQRGDWDFKLAEVYTVGILDFVFAEDGDKKEVRHQVTLKDQNGIVFYKKLYKNELIEPFLARGCYKEAIKKHHIAGRIEDDTTRLYYQKFLETEVYKNFISKSTSKDDYRFILLELYKFLYNSESFVEQLEDFSPSWIDDESLIIGSIKKTLKAMPEETELFTDFTG